MRPFARRDGAVDLMARRTSAAGWLLMAVAALHAAFGLWVGRRAVLAMARDGFVNAVDPHPDRSLVFWFLLMSPFLWIVGRLALWLASEGKRPPAWLGRSLLGVALACAVLMPASGFWLLVLPAAWLWLAARAPHAA
jgi:uncharacterized protein DUF6463